MEVTEAAQDVAKKRLAFQKSYSLEHGGSWGRRSLIDGAKFDRATNEQLEKEEQTVRRSSNSSYDELLLSQEEVGDNDAFTCANGEAESQSPQLRKCSLMFSLRELGGMSRVFKHFENCRVAIQHIETRKSAKKNCTHLEFFVCFEGSRDDIIMVVKSLHQNSVIQDVQILTEKDSADRPGLWIPRHISELDKCQHLLTKFDPDLDYEHPGFADKHYRERRQKLSQPAFEYRYGQQIPRIEYTDEETETWTHVYRHMTRLLPTHACKEHVQNLRLLEREGVYSEHHIPQQQDVSDFLKRRSGFQLRPVAGLLSARDFLASLAFRVFQCTQYIRHGSKPDHTPEPDCVHELLGHIPMLAEPGFAQFSQELGLASLGASDEDIEKFATLYWFTVEFGLLKQEGELRAYGAGLLSAYGELEHSLSDKPAHLTFEPKTTALQEYDDQQYQEVYYIAESFDDMKEKMRQYVASIRRPFEIRYDPYTQSINILDNKEVIQDISRVLKGEMNCLQNVLTRIDNLTLA